MEPKEREELKEEIKEEIREDLFLTLKMIMDIIENNNNKTKLQILKSLENIRGSIDNETQT